MRLRTWRFCLSAWAYRHELGPVAGMKVRLLASGWSAASSLSLRPSGVFDVIIPWLLLFAFFGRAYS